MNPQLRDYQADTADFLVHTHRANCFMDLGMGKTAALLEVIQRRYLTDVLILCPWMVARYVWPLEPQKWPQYRHIQVEPMIGTEAERSRFLLAPPRVTVMNYELLPWLFDVLLEHKMYFPWAHVIFDESSRLQGLRMRRSSQRTALLSQVAFRGVRSWYNLSGTPIANGYDRMWGSQWFVDEGEALGNSFSAFQERFYMRPIHGGIHSKLVLQPFAAEEIQERMRPTTRVVRGQDYYKLEAPVERTFTFELNPAARHVYRDMQYRLKAEIEGNPVTAFNAGVKFGKLMQISSGAVYYTDKTYGVVHRERLDIVDSLLSELAGNPLLLVVQYDHERQEIHRRFKCPDIRDPGMLAAWNTGEVPLMTLHAASAGHGVNLQHGGHHICFFSPYADAELAAQVVERIGPIRQYQAGFHRPVFIHHIEAAGTVDQHARSIREGRIDMLEGFKAALATIL